MRAASHFNKLTPAEAERLFWLLEELGEVQHAIGKVLRHGYERRDPTKGASLTNREILHRELGGALCALGLLIDSGDLTKDVIDGIAAKGLPLRYMHHQSDTTTE